MSNILQFRRGETMPKKEFDDAPQWYWAVASMRTDKEKFERADGRFVVAAGQRELWARVRAEIAPDEECGWFSLGPKDGNATLADCLTALITAREQYGASYNRIVMELARVPSFARYIVENTKTSDLCNLVSNPISEASLTREPYNRDVEEALGRRVESTLHMESDEWRR